MDQTPITITTASKRGIALVLALLTCVHTVGYTTAITYDAATTEYYDTIDDFGYANGTDSIGLRFGGTLGEYLRYNQALGRFVLTDDLDVQGTISGSALTIMGNASISGSLVLEGGTALSGATIRGFGLATDCDDANGSKVLWDATTARFSCGTDETGTFSNWSNTGSLQTAFDSRYVNQSGDTMTGALTIQHATSQAKALSLVGSGSYTIMSASGGSIIHSARGNPQLVGTYDTDSARDIAISGRYVYIADDTSGLQIIDVSNPASPTLVGTYNTSGNGLGVRIAGRYAYVADGTFGLQIIDVSNPASPTLVGTYDTDEGKGVAIAGRYAYVADGHSGLQIIDVSNPASPKLVGTYNTSGSAYAVSIAGRYAYVADSIAGLRIIDISSPASPTLVGTYDTSGTAYAVAIAGRYAYVADQASGLQIIDVSSPASPTLVGTYDTPGSAIQVAIAGRYAYLADGSSGFQVIDISNPASPTLVGTYDTFGYTFGLSVAGRYAYVADGSPGLRIIDLNGFDTPTASIGALETFNLSVRESARMNSNLTVDRSLNVGDGMYVFGQTAMRGFSGAALTLSTQDRNGAPALNAIGTISGTTLNANTLLTGSTLQGFGLYNCNGTSNKLTYNAATKKFLCEADQTGGGASNWSNTGSLQTAFDSRYVNQSGDTMTGALTINLSSGFLGLKVVQTASGKIFHAEQSLTSSGTLRVEGAASFDDALTFGDALSDLITVNAASWTFANDTNFALSGGVNGLSFDTTTFSVDALNDRIGIGTTTPDTTLEVVGTVSGSSVWGYNLNNSQSATSGSILVSRQNRQPEWKTPVSSLVWFLDGGAVQSASQGATVTMPFGMTLTSVTLRAKTAPTGSALIVDINENGTTLFSTRPQINAGATTGGSSAVFSDTSLAAGSDITVDIDQVGSTLTGSGITIMLNGTRHY